ncbi:hypothetical protein ACWTU6_29590 [Mesorhizobium sp. BHbsci]
MADLTPEKRKTALGEIAGLGLLTPDGEPVRAVDALKPCSVVYPASVDEMACVYLNEVGALSGFAAVNGIEP